MGFFFGNTNLLTEIKCYMDFYLFPPKLYYAYVNFFLREYIKGYNTLSTKFLNISSTVLFSFDSYGLFLWQYKFIN